MIDTKQRREHYKEARFPRPALDKTADHPDDALSFEAFLIRDPQIATNHVLQIILNRSVFYFNKLLIQLGTLLRLKISLTDAIRLFHQHSDIVASIRQKLEPPTDETPCKPRPVILLLLYDNRGHLRPAGFRSRCSI